VTKKKTKKTNWEKLKAQSAIPRVDAGGQKWTPAIGKYQVKILNSSREYKRGKYHCTIDLLFD
jgi:hypothetical protein